MNPGFWSCSYLCDPSGCHSKPGHHLQYNTNNDNGTIFSMCLKEPNREIAIQSVHLMLKLTYPQAAYTRTQSCTCTATYQRHKDYNYCVICL